MVTAVKDSTRPTARRLANQRPTRTLSRVEDTDTRKKRLAVLVKRARMQAGISSAAALAELTGGLVSESSIARLESAARILSTSKMNALEDALSLPLGVMDAVLAGEIREFPAAAGQAAFTVRDQVYTRAELKTLAKALGPNGFTEWALAVEDHGDTA